MRIVVFDNVNLLEGSSTPIDQALAHLHETMAEITTKCTIGTNIELCDHATLLLRGITSNIHHLHLAQVHKPMHLEMVFRWVDDGFGNFN
jgi:hypothetical protein